MSRARQSGKSQGEVFEPARLLHMISLGINITVHCRECGHWLRMDPKTLPLAKSRSIPSLEGVFRCSQCNSRNTCAMPEYVRPKPGGG
jgi:hypothetical protein